jgi:hypothetical protein
MTTQRNRRRDDRGMKAIWIVAIVLNLAVVLPFIVWDDLRRSDFTVEPKTAEQLEAERKQREELAKKPKPELDKDQVRQAKEHIERRKREELKKKVEELKTLKTEIEELKDEQLDALEQRDADEFLDQLVEAVKDQAQALRERAEDLERGDQNQDARSLREQAQALEHEANQLQKPQTTDTGAKQVADPQQVQKVADVAKKVAETSKDYADKQPSAQATDVASRAERLAERAASLAGNDAQAALDGFSSDQTPTASAIEEMVATVAEQAQEMREQAEALEQNDQTQDATQLREQAQSVEQAASQLQDSQATPEGDKQLADPELAQKVAAVTQDMAAASQDYAQKQTSDTATDVANRAEQLADRAAAMASTVAKAATDASNADMAQMDSDALYDQARALEQQIAEQFADSKAAELALTQDTSFQKGLEAVSTPRTQSADLGDALSSTPQTREELAAFSKALDNAIANAARAADRARDQLGQAQGRQQGREGGENGQGHMALSAMNAAALNSALGQASLQEGNGRGMMVDLTGLMSQAYGGGSAESGIRAGSNQAEGGAGMLSSVRKSQINLDANRIKAQALPGRKFSRSSARTGWLFIDSWYVLGPFENHGRIDYTQRHPPETQVDLDAITSASKGVTSPGNICNPM